MGCQRVDFKVNCESVTKLVQSDQRVYFNF